MRNQALGLGARLSEDIQDFVVNIGWPWRALPAHWVPGGVLELPKLQAQNVLISCGRRSGAFAIALKQQHPHLFTVNIQNPQIPFRYFDLVVPMTHDNCQGPNVFPVATALHNLNQEKLAMAAASFAQPLAQLPEKKVAFILGGNTKDYTFSDQNLTQVLAAIDSLLAQGFGVMLTTARRTPAFVIDALAQIRRPGLWMYLGQGENPYHCFLAEAQGFIMTSDSVSMLSEAMYTGKPIYVIDLNGYNRRLNQFKQQGLDQGWIRSWQGAFQHYSYPAQDSVQSVADKIKQMLSNR